MKKRIASILLCFCMVLGLLPMSALAADVDWSAMYASDSVIQPTPSSYISANGVVWADADSGVKMTGASSAGKDFYYGIMLNVPDDAYYNMEFTLKGNSSTDAYGSYVGYVVGQSTFGAPEDGLDKGSAYEKETPKAWSISGLKGTNVELYYMLISGSAKSDDNYMLISDVKFTRLTNAVTVTPSGTGSGTFDVSSDAGFNKAATGASSYSADIGRGSQITLTAHPSASSYFDHWEDSAGTSISTDAAITVTVGDSAADTAAKAYNPVFKNGTDPNVTKLLDSNTRNELTGDDLRVTHMGSSWEACSWQVMDSSNPLWSSIANTTTDSAATLDLTLNVTAENSVFYGLVLPGSSTKGDTAYMTVTVDGASVAVGGASSGSIAKPNCNSFAIPVTTGSHTVSFRLRDKNSTAYLLGLGLVSGDSRSVTLKAADLEELTGCTSYTVTVNGTDVTDDVQSTNGYKAPYGAVAQFESVNADGTQYTFQGWSTGGYSATSVIPDVATEGKGQLVLRGDVTLTPVYTEGVNVASAIMADATEKAPDGSDYQWTMNSASYFSVNTDGAVAIAEGGVLTLQFTVPEGKVYMSRIQGKCALALYKDGTAVGSYTPFQPTGYCYNVLGAGSYKMVFTGSDTCALDNFTCQPYGTISSGKVTVTATQTDVSGASSDVTEALADSGALSAPDYIIGELDSLGYVAGGYTGRIVMSSTITNFTLDKTKLETAGLSAQSADKADGSETVSFETNGNTLSAAYSNFYVNPDSSRVNYSYSIHVNLSSTAGYPYLSGTTLYANGCPIYVDGSGNVYFYNKTDGSHTEPVKNLSAGGAQITLQNGATIYGGSDKSDVAGTYVSLAYNTAGYTVFGGGNGYGVTGSSVVLCPGGTVNMINGGNNGNGTKPASITVTGTSSAITAANGVTGGSATGDVTVTVADLVGDLTGGSSEKGTVTVNAGTTSLHSITGSVIGVPTGGAASTVVINAPASVSGSILGAKLGSVVGNITVNVTGTVAGGAITGAENATVTGDVTVHVSDTTIGSSTAIYGQSNSTVGGDVAVTVSGGSCNPAGVYGSSGGSVAGKVSVKTASAVSGKVQGSVNGSAGSVEIITDGAVNGSVTGLSGGSAGAVTVTTNQAVTDAVCAVRDATVTGDVSLTVNAQAKSAAAVQAASAAASVDGKVTLTMGENAVLTNSAMLVPILSTDGEHKVTVTGDVALNQHMTALADTVTLSDRDENSTVSGASSLNIYADNGQQIVLRGGDTGGAVNLFVLYAKPVYVPQDKAALVLDSSVTGGYYVKQTSDQSGFDLYTLVNLTKPFVDVANKRIIGNGFPLKVSGDGIFYDSGSGWQSIATGDLSAYTVYGGAEQTAVPNSSITFSGVSAQSPGTYFGGGKNSDVTGDISISLEGSNDFGRAVTIYGGAENADVTGKLNLRVNYDASSSNTNMVTWFAGCKNGAFHGDAQIDIQRDNTASGTVQVFKLPGTFYLCSENGAFDGKIDLYTGAMNYRTDITGGIHDVYGDTGKISGGNTIHLLSYTDSTATPITRTSEKTTVTGAGDPNFKSVSWEDGVALLSYHVVLNTADVNNIFAEITDTDEAYILYAAGGLYFDAGAVGEEDSADVLVRGFAKQGLRYYFGTESAKLPAGENLTFTMDSAAWVFFYMNGSLTLNLNTSLPSGGNSGVVIGDTAESVLLTIGRADGGTEAYTVISNQMWYSKLVVNKPFEGGYGIAIKKGIDYSEDNITLNLDKSKYATEKNTDTWGGIYCKLKGVSTVVVNPTEEAVGKIGEDGEKLEGDVLIFADGGVNYAAVDTDQDGVLDGSENEARVQITFPYPDALPGSHITMLSGSLDFFSFYGEAFTQRGGSITNFYVYPASKSATILQEAGCTLPSLKIKSVAETKSYTPDPTCVINVEIGGNIKTLESSNAAANIKLLSTADPGSDGVFAFGKANTFGTLDFSDYTLKHLDSTNKYYTDISYFNERCPIKPTAPATLKIVADGDNYRYCPDSTTDAVDIVNISADFGSVYYGYDVSGVARTLDLSTTCPNMFGGSSSSSNFELAVDTAAGKVTVKPKSGLEPGVYQGICNISYTYYTTQSFQFPVSITVLPQTVTVTPNGSLVTYSGSGNTSWKQGYTLSPAVTLAAADKDLLVYYGEATPGTHELHLSKTRSSDNHYDFVLATDKTCALTISAYDGNQGYPIESAAATVPDTWGAYALITAPEGYLVSLTADGTYTKSVKWNASSSTQAQNNITYYIKDNTTSSASYLLTLPKTIDGVKVCTDGDLANYTPGTVTPAATTADVTFNAALKDDAAGACGLSKICVLAVPTGNAAPTVDTVLASGTAATKTSGDYAVTLTGLSANTAYAFYAAHTTEAGVKASAVANLGSAATKGVAPTVTTVPAASGIYRTALSALPLLGGVVTGQTGAALAGTWQWTQTNADSTYPEVGGSTGFDATFTPNDMQYSPVTVQVIPAMTPLQISATGAVAEGRSYVKSNTSVTITGVSFSDGISLNFGSDYTATGTMANANAGESKAVTVTVTMLNGNYTLSANTTATTVNISKASASAPAEQTVSRRYNMTGEQTVSVTGLMPDDAGGLTYAKGTESGKTTILSVWSVEADGTVKYTLAGGAIGDSVTLPVKINSTNYAETTVNVVITLTGKDNQTAPDAFTLQFSLNSDGTTYTATIPAVSGAEYSFNGTDWSDTNTKSGIAPNESVTGYIRMKATDDKNASDMTSNTKTTPPLTVKTPIASPSGGSFYGTQTVTLTCATSGADVYYTTDGSTPTSGSTKYTAAFTISDTTTVKAIAIKDGMNTSAVLTVTFSKFSGGGPSGGGNATTQITIPVSSNEGSIQVEVTVKDGTATVSMTDAQLKAIASGQTAAGTVTVDMSELEVDEATVPAKLVSAVQSAEGFRGLAVVLPTGTVTLDKAALASVADKGDISFSVETVSSAKYTDAQKEILGIQAGSAVVVDVNVYAGGVKTGTFGDGKITISLPYTLKSGENADSITVWFVKDDGTIEPKTASYANGKVTFTTEHLSQYLIVRFPFTDVPENAWYYGSVAYAYNNGLFAGTSDTTFSPDTAMTRQMIWMVLARMDGKAPDNMDEARSWAMENGISDGSSPTNSITREQMATILYRYAQYKSFDTTQGGMAIREFADYDSISEYALPALAWAVNAGLIQGSDHYIMPNGSATRAQVAAILMRFCQNVAK